MADVQLAGLMKTGVIPGGVALVVLLLLWRPWRREYVTPRHPIPIAMALGFLAGSVAIVGWQGSTDVWGLVTGVFDGSTALWESLRDLWLGVWRGLWPLDPTRRIGQYALVGLVGAFAVSRLPESEALRWLLVRLAIQMVVVGLVAFFLLEPRMRHAWSGLESVAAVLGLAAVGTIWWSGIGAAAIRRAGASLPLTLAAVSVMSAGTLVVTGSAALGQQGVAFGVVLAVCSAGAMLRPDLVDTRAIGAVPAVVFASLWGGGTFYADGTIPVGALVLLGIGPLLVWVVQGPGIRNWWAWQAGLVQVLLVVVVLGSAAAVASTAERAAEKGKGPVGGSGEWGATGGGEEGEGEREGDVEPILDGDWLFEDEGTGEGERR